MSSKLNKLLYVSKHSENSKMSKTHGACIYKSNKLICSGINSERSCYFKNVMCSTHAEVDVLRKLVNNFSNFYKNNVYDIRRKMKKFTMFVSRDNFNVSSKPCKDCMDQLNRSGIHKIYYSTGDKDIINSLKTDETDKTRKSPVNLIAEKYTKIRTLVKK